jgi:predicted TPR repeat methyltransferase
VAEPGLPPQIEPLSFVSPGLLRYVLRALALAAGQVLVDLGCGRGGPGRARIDWPPLLRGAGFAGVEMEARAEWQDTFTGVYRAALGLGDPGDDARLADLQDEARRRLPLADLQDRVAVIATAPYRPTRARAAGW